MRCANCGAEVSDGTVFCPHCGHRVKSRVQVEPPVAAAPAPAPASPEKARPTPRMVVEPDADKAAPARPSGCKWLMLTGAFTLLFLLIILGLGALGAYHGLQDQNREKLQLAQTHYEKGLGYLAEGNYGLAVAEMQEAVRLNPDFEGAKIKLAEAQALSAASPTPTGNAYLQAAEQLYRDARTEYNQRNWEATIAKLDELRAVDASYQQQEVETLLFWAYYNSGLALVNDGRMEEAVHRFDQALALQPKNPDVLGQRHLASLYVSGLGYWGADWGAAIEKFDAVYRIESNYRDVRQRLHDAHVNYGDLLASKNEWCNAAKQYDAALQIIDTEAVRQRRDNAATRCSAGG
ncbi:MAG: tetratricopeptide repeat protein [Chloroflexi bacterium]|nr:tetratricopeptide repeat protein [Chloroflexota bacterium]